MLKPIKSILPILMFIASTLFAGDNLGISIGNRINGIEDVRIQLRRGGN